jgi:hypothetical protein
MGLGKTLQSASFVQHLKYQCDLPGPTMIVAPLSTLAHWQREFSSWTDLNAIIFHGDKESRSVIRNSEFFHQCGEWPPKLLAVVSSPSLLLSCLRARKPTPVTTKPLCVRLYNEYDHRPKADGVQREPADEEGAEG